ncbi:hypothetical protein [Streptomyces sp. NPDC088794]|uniref:hypothetical protein n=1 Tax=Streptomyces sp. NPDC088794 TaxID=3365902 RepID=UPI003810483C
MTTTFRQLAVTGGTAALLIGGAAAVTVAVPSPASAATQHVAARAVTAPVNLPDGRTLRITGMGGYGHQATGQHIATVAAFKTDTTPGADPSLGTGLTPNGGAGAQLQNPVNGTQTGYNQQVTTQASGAAISVTVAIGIGLLIGVIVMVRRGTVKFVPAFACVALGVYLAPTMVGPMITNLGGSVGGSLGNLWAGF